MNYSVLFLLINLLFFGAVAYYFLRVRKQLSEEKKEEFLERKFDEERIERAEEMLREELQEVRVRANAILAESEKIATGLMGELERVLGKEHADVSVDLPKGSDFEVRLTDLSRNLKNHYVIRIQNLLKSLEKYELQEAEKVRKFADEQENATGKSLQKMRIDMLSQIKEKLDRYKDEEIKLFDEKVKKVIDEAALDVLGHSLTNSELDEIVKKAIDVARQKHVI